MNGFLATLHEWQEIAGAVIGGIFALLVALIVARDARRRVEKSSAMVVIGVLTTFRAAFIQARSRSGQGTAEEQAVTFAGMIAAVAPEVPDHYGQSVAALLPVHNHLAAHLTHIGLFQQTLFQALARLHRDIETDPDKPLRRPKGESVADAKMVRQSMERISNACACAIVLAERLVLSRWSFIHRLRLRFVPDELEKVCAKALFEGDFAKPMPENLRVAWEWPRIFK